MSGGVRKGLTPYKAKGGGVYTGGQERALVSNGYNQALAVGDPIYVSAGNIRIAANASAGEFIAVAGSAITNLNTVNREYGVFMGCRYVDAEGQVKDTTYFPAATSSGGVLEGETAVLGYYVPAAQYTFLAIASASVSALQAGSLFGVEVSSPSSIFKRSTAKVNTVAASAGVAHMVRIKGFPNIAGTRPDDATTVVEVELVLPTTKS